MRLLRLADQNVAAMDKVHFYVCQTDASMSHYLTKAVSDAGWCTHDETLRLMNACSQDVDEANNGDNNNNDEEVTIYLCTLILLPLSHTCSLA
jgi:hypothetical protein